MKCGHFGLTRFTLLISSRKLYNLYPELMLMSLLLVKQRRDIERFLQRTVHTPVKWYAQDERSGAVEQIVSYDSLHFFL